MASNSENVERQARADADDIKAQAAHDLGREPTLRDRLAGPVDLPKPPGQPKTVRARDLKLGDVIRLSPACDAYRDAVVKQLAGGSRPLVVLFRPYAHSGDFSYTGGVICYTGTEEWSIPRDDSPVERIRHGRALK